MLASDMRALIVAQLPRDLQGRLSVIVDTDAYRVGGKVRLMDGKGGSWEVRLLAMDIEGVPIACRMPDWFIDHLCLVAA